MNFYGGGNLNINDQSNFNYAQQNTLPLLQDYLNGNQLINLNGSNQLLANEIQQQQQLQQQNDQNLNYYQEYCKLFIANVVLTSQVFKNYLQIKELLTDKNELLNKLQTLEGQANLLGQNQSPNDTKKKRFRRVAVEVERNYRCPGEACVKSYGSEGSLIQHIKIKHPDYNLVELQIHFAKSGQIIDNNKDDKSLSSYSSKNNSALKKENN